MAKQVFSVPISFQSAPAEALELYVFLFNRNGQLLQRVKVGTKGLAEFDDPGISPSEWQLLVVPNLDNTVERIKTMAELERYRPYKPVLKWNNNRKIEILPIPDLLAKWWKLRFCRTTGVVEKNFLLNGKVEKLPLCKARVHICEIDKINWVLPKIPDIIISRIPELVFHPPIPPVVFRPWPPKPPLPIDPFGPIIFDRLRPDIFKPIVVKPIRFSTTDASMANSSAAVSISSLPPLNDEVKRAFSSGNLSLMRTAIAKNFDLLHPFFCLAPWTWPYLYRSDEIKVVYTDENGRFDTSVLYWAGGDIPDLYFWVEYLIDGEWVTVYKPPIPCNTWWDYACGTEVSILVTDNRVKPSCGTVMAKDALWLRRIGGRSILSVCQQPINTPIQGVPFYRQGLFLHGTDYRSPLGTTSGSNRMHFMIKFGSLLPNANARYFRWACKKVSDENMLPVIAPVQYLTDGIAKTYTIEWTDIFGDTHFSSRAVSLGPVNLPANQTLFHIPPANPNGFLGVSDATARWDNTDTYTTNLDTRSLDGAGLYEFWLEIFDNAGNQVNKPDAFFQIPKAGDEANSENATAPWVGINNGFNSFNMLVRIDNHACQAAIYPVQLTNPARVANACGFIKYADPGERNVSISFKAFHTNDFADFNFTVVRGNTGTGGAATPASVSGMVIGPVGRYVRNAAGDYRPGTAPTDNEFSPTELMGPCLLTGKAAFAQSVYVAALHTDGYRQLTEYDASALAAFALEA